MRGAGKGRIDAGGVAFLPVEDDVAGSLRPNSRCVLRHRACNVADGRELPVLDRYGFSCVERLGHRLGDNEGHRLADIAHAGRSQGRHAG